MLARPASSAASFTMFARSAPVAPAAAVRELTSGRDAMHAELKQLCDVTCAPCMSMTAAGCVRAPGVRRARSFRDTSRDSGRERRCICTWPAKQDLREPCIERASRPRIPLTKANARACASACRILQCGPLPQASRLSLQAPRLLPDASACLSRAQAGGHRQPMTARQPRAQQGERSVVGSSKQCMREHRAGC